MTSTITLVSAAPGDIIDGTELAELGGLYARLCDLGAKQWLDSTGYGPDNPDQLVYVLDDDAALPAGHQTFRVEVPTLTPREAAAREVMHTMPAAELLEMHLSYGVGNHDSTDEEVWRRFPHLRTAYGRMQAMQQEFTRQRAEAGPIDLDELPPATPGHAEAMEAYEAEVRRHASE